MASAILVRPAVHADLSTLGRLAAGLVRYHRALDSLRYLRIDSVEEGYANFLSGELDSEKAVVLCACRQNDSRVLGYTYGTLEGRDWNALLDVHGALHDVFVDPSARKQGIAEKLVRETCRCLEALGAPRVVLHTAVQNAEAQALFAKLGFRSTMIEMTREPG